MGVKSIFLQDRGSRDTFPLRFGSLRRGTGQTELFVSLSGNENKNLQAKVKCGLSWLNTDHKEWLDRHGSSPCVRGQCLNQQNVSLEGILEISEFKYRIPRSREIEVFYSFLMAHRSKNRLLATDCTYMYTHVHASSCCPCFFILLSHVGNTWILASMNIFINVH